MYSLLGAIYLWDPYKKWWAVPTLQMYKVELSLLAEWDSERL